MADDARLGLSPRQRKAALALVAGHEIATAAAVAGVSESTLYRWRRQDEFQRALRALQSELIVEHQTGLVGLLRGNRDVLAGIRDDESQPGHVRLRAVEIIENSLRAWRDAVEFEERLSELERAVGDA